MLKQSNILEPNVEKAVVRFLSSDRAQKEGYLKAMENMSARIEFATVEGVATRRNVVKVVRWQANRLGAWKPGRSKGN